MRALLLSLALLAGAPASGSAALGQVEPVKVSQDESCLGATGRPGEISSPTSAGVRFFVATREGLKPGGRVQLADGQFRCEAVAGKPTGAGVIVANQPPAKVTSMPGRRAVPAESWNSYGATDHPVIACGAGRTSSCPRVRKTCGSAVR